MKRYQIMFLGSILGILSYLFLPSAWKLLGFLFPLISLSLVFSEKAKKINITVLLLFSLIYLIFPTSMFSLDVTSSFNTNGIVNFINSSLNVVGSIVVIGIPTLLLTTAVASYMSLQFEEGNEIVLKLIIMVGFLILFLTLATLFDWDFGVGLIDGIRNIADKIINWVNDALFSSSIDNEMQGGYSDYELRFESLDSINSSNSVGLLLLTGFPIALSFVQFIFGIVFYFKQDKSNKIIDNMVKKETIRLNKPFRFNLNMVYYMIILLICGFGLYLSYDLESILTYQNQGFFSIYLIISVVSLILLSLGIGSYSKTGKNGFVGIIYGIVGLFIFFNLFSQIQTLEMLSFEYSEITTNRIISQFLFVAPSESLLFHILIPSIYLFSIMYFNDRNSNEKIRSKITELNIDNHLLESYSDSNLQYNQIIKKDNTDIYKNFTKSILKNKRNIRKLQKKLINDVILDSETKISNNQFIVYIVISVISNVIFATFHYFKTGLSLLDFWLYGIGLVYLGSGLWITFIGYRYGWMSAIMVHALNNAITLVLMVI